MDVKNVRRHHGAMIFMSFKLLRKEKCFDIHRADEGETTNVVLIDFRNLLLIPCTTSNSFLIFETFKKR